MEIRGRRLQKTGVILKTNRPMRNGWLPDTWALSYLPILRIKIINQLKQYFCSSLKKYCLKYRRRTKWSHPDNTVVYCPRYGWFGQSRKYKKADSPAHSQCIDSETINVGIIYWQCAYGVRVLFVSYF